MNTKIQNIIGWTLSALVGFCLVATGYQKFTDPAMAESLGGANNAYFLGGLEWVTALLFLVPRTVIIGFLMAVAYFGGAIAVHFVSNEPLALQVGIAVVIWIAGFFRMPKLRDLFMGRF